MADVTNVKLGVCSIKWDGDDLGHTKGGVEVTYAPEWYDMTVDKYGNTIYDKALMGEKLTAKVPLVESTIANMKAAMPAGTADADKLTLGKQAGLRLSSLAGQLVLHPIANAANDFSEDVVFHKAASTGEIMTPFKFDGERIMEVIFESLLDETKADGNYLGIFGDYTA